MNLREKLERIERLASEATEGPWTVHWDDEYATAMHIQDADFGFATKDEDAAYIAAVNPKVGRALLECAQIVAETWPDRAVVKALSDALGDD